MNSKKLQVKFGKVEQFNSSFSKCNVAIAYSGDNRNMTSISREVFEKMIPSLYGVPIVGEWKGEDFGSHGGKIEITDEGVDYTDTTIPIGFVDSQAKVWWEDITEEDGTINSYLFSECILWTGRYSHVKTILDNNSSQSMEIEVDSGHIREDGYYEIESGQFSALCVLGDSVEPCFESSAFGQFDLSKDKFKAEFNLMMKELKESVKGGENVDNEKAIEVEDEQIIETEKDIPIGVEEVSTEISLSTEVETVKEEETEEEIVIEEEAKVEEVEEEVTEEVEVANIEEETDTNTGQEIGSDDFAELKLENDNLKIELNSLKAELEELREFKSSALAEQKAEEVDEVFAKYSEMLNNSEMEDLFEPALEMELDALEKELSFRLVQKKFDFNKITKKDSTKISIVKDEKDNDPYGSASIYFNK